MLTRLHVTPARAARYLPFCLCIQSALAFAIDWPLLNFPPGTVIEPMAGEIRHNGYLLQLNRFLVRHPPGQVVQFFMSSWRASRPTYRELGDWKIVSKKEGDFVTTVEIREDGANRAEGISAVRYLQNIHTLERGIPRDIPVPPTATVSSILQSDDRGRTAVTITLSCRMSAPSLHAYFLKELPRQGWRTREKTFGQSRGSTYLVFLDKANRGGLVQISAINGFRQSVIHIDNGN